jgi:hypothetical protein
MIRFTLPLALCAVLVCPAFGEDLAEEEARQLVVEQQYDLGNAETAELELNMPAGHLEIEPGSAALVQAKYEIPDSTFLPEAEYVIEDGRGRLEIDLEDIGQGAEGDRDIEWDIRLNGDAVEELDVELGVGDVAIEQVWPGLEEASVEVGVGELSANLEGGLKASEVEFSFEVGIGDVSITLPDDVGFRIETEVGIGDIDAGDLKPAGDDEEENDETVDVDDEGEDEEDDDTEQTWVNELWGKAPVNVEISVEVGIGEITITTAERD